METVFSLQSIRSPCSSLPCRTCVRHKEQTWLLAGRGPSPSSWSDSSEWRWCRCCCSVSPAARDGFTVSEIHSGFCSQHMHAALLILSTVSWSSALWMCACGPYLKAMQIWWQHLQKRREEPIGNPQQFGDKLTNQMISAILGLKPQKENLTQLMDKQAQLTWRQRSRRRNKYILLTKPTHRPF